MEVFYFGQVQNYIHRLDKPARSHVYKTIDFLKLYGHQLGLPQSRALGGGLYELRSRGNPEIRMFYAFYRTKAVILHVFQKKSQKTPDYELELARKRLRLLTKI